MYRYKLFIYLIILAILYGCAPTTNIITLSREKVDCRDEILVFKSLKEAPNSYITVAEITHTDYGKYKRRAIDNMIPFMQETARKEGANGIIIDDYYTIYSGIWSRGIYLKFKAIIVKR